MNMNTNPNPNTNTNDKLGIPTLDDLIQRGVEIRERRLAEERARMKALQEKQAREKAEKERAIRSMLPAALKDLAEIEIDEFLGRAYIFIARPFPGEGRVRILATQQKDGGWRLLEFGADNPQGYHLEFQTLEEALAYASGKLEI
jgi:hypothetical protein